MNWLDFLVYVLLALVILLYGIKIISVFRRKSVKCPFCGSYETRFGIGMVNPVTMKVGDFSLDEKEEGFEKMRLVWCANCHMIHLPDNPTALSGKGRWKIAVETDKD